MVAKDGLAMSLHGDGVDIQRRLTKLRSYSFLMVSERISSTSMQHAQSRLIAPMVVIVKNGHAYRWRRFGGVLNWYSTNIEVAKPVVQAPYPIPPTLFCTSLIFMEVA